MFNLIIRRDVVSITDWFFTQYFDRVLHAIEGSEQQTRESFWLGTIRSCTGAIDGQEWTVF